MFTRKDQLQRKGGPEERFSFLKQLHNEFETSKSNEAKLQVIANLANFAYDPINYEFIKKLKIIDLFLEQLSGNIEEFISHAVGGLCNLCLDPENAEYIIRNNGIYLISELLLHRNVEISTNAITTLIFLIKPESQHFITTPEIINKIIESESHPDIRVRNLCTIFLQDYCTSDQINFAKQSAS